MPRLLIRPVTFNCPDCVRGSRRPIRSAHPAEVRAAGSGVVHVRLQQAKPRGVLLAVDCSVDGTPEALNTGYSKVCRMASGGAGLREAGWARE